VESLAPALLEAAEGRAREMAAASRGASLCFFAASVETELRALLELSGYDQRGSTPHAHRPAGAWWGNIAPPVGVGGIEIRAMRLGADDRAIHAAIEESFADHFRHTPAASMTGGRFERGTSASIRALAPRLGGESRRRRAHQLRLRDIGFVRELGVLKPWRGRGVGSALLARSFEMFRARGQFRVALGVDAENAGAMGLYERVGMRPIPRIRSCGEIAT